MDYNKSGGAPPMGWSADKSPSGTAPAPPAYQDRSGPGYSPQGYGYNQYGGGGYAQQPYPAGQQQYPAAPGAVTMQPTVYVTQGPLANPVNDYLCYSIFTMLCCCLPLGIAALIYSISTREANYSGNQVAAERSSKMARTLNHVALGIGIGFTILMIVYVAVVASVANN